MIRTPENTTSDIRRKEKYLAAVFPRSKKVHNYSKQLPLDARGRPVDQFRIRHEFFQRNRFSNFTHKQYD